jgi:hypothetical protein
MKSAYVLRLLIVFACLCIGHFAFDHHTPRYVRLAHKLTEKTAKKLKAQKRLYLIGTGGSMMHNIQVLDMSFHLYHEADLNTARNTIISATQEYLNEVNNSVKIRRYLHKYPFGAENLEIRIWFYNPDGSTPLPEKIEYASAIRGRLCYYTEAEGPHQPICTETYEEACALLERAAELSFP